MSSWRYQIFQHRDDGGEPYLAIHEYYTLHDEREAWTLKPVPIEADTVEDLRTELLRIVDDLDKYGVRDIETGMVVQAEDDQTNSALGSTSDENRSEQ